VTAPNLAHLVRDVATGEQHDDALLLELAGRLDVDSEQLLVGILLDQLTGGLVLRIEVAL
jgi:hypothetical protein